MFYSSPRLAAGYLAVWDLELSHVAEWATHPPLLACRWLHQPLSKGQDVTFLGESPTLLVAAGQGAGGRNVAVCDILRPPAVSQVCTLVAHSTGATRVEVVSQGALLLSGGEDGDLMVHDLRMVEAGAAPVMMWLKSRAHSAPVTAMALGNVQGREVWVTGGRDGSLRVWDVRAQELVQAMDQVHSTEARPASFLLSAFTRLAAQGPAGADGGRQGSMISTLCLADEGLISGGHDGAIKLFPWAPALLSTAY